MKTLEEILALLEFLRSKVPGSNSLADALNFADACSRALPELIAVRDELRKVMQVYDLSYFPGKGEKESLLDAVGSILGTPPANPKPAAEEEPRT